MGLKTGLSIRNKKRNERKGERLFEEHEVIKNCRCKGTNGMERILCRTSRTAREEGTGRERGYSKIVRRPVK